jgi:alanyl-tRNA synthetase
MPSANDIRRQFIDFFVEKHGHTFVPSSSVVPLDDPTLLFTNAGMNQFKDVFLGTGSRPYQRAVNTQKCIRAGGKHNDLDDVGKDTYHHTFFEMLGNWSFGDYFKKEAIAWAWELLTGVWGLDKGRLHATVFEGGEGVPRDGEAFEFWKTQTDIDHGHIHWGSKKDNFWEMGETGPCGPCTEIHYDRTPDKTGGVLVNAGKPEVIEIWNLVFIQFNRDQEKKLTPLPAKHVDTGMGFERITAVLQQKDSNYDTDVFSPIFERIRKVTRARKYSGRLDDLVDTAYRVIADHIRTLTVALADGAMFSYEGRGYVLRRILRRAERFGKQYLGTKEPFLGDLVGVVASTLETVFPELRRTANIHDYIASEEESFLQTLDRGLKLFHEAAGRAKSQRTNTISGEDAFVLHDTHGVYIDITQQMAAEAGLSLDLPGYEERMHQAKETSRGAQKKQVVYGIEGELPKTDDSLKYHPNWQGAEEATILGWIEGNKFIQSGRLHAGRRVALILDRTNFYAEQGGQVGDKGRISASSGSFKVEDTQGLGHCVIHVGSIEDRNQSTEWLEAGQEVRIVPNPSLRDDTMRNHTSTHLLNWALRKVLGEKVEQKGSLVDPGKTRFDFSHSDPLTRQEIAEVERLVNEMIYKDLPVHAVLLPLSVAKRIPGVRAVFGEKYPDPVRIVAIGLQKEDFSGPFSYPVGDDVSSEELKSNLQGVSHIDAEEFSIEFCGGTHLKRTGEAGFFKIVSQELVGKGVRRVTAVTGREAVTTVQGLASVVAELTSRFNCKPEDLPSRVEALQEEIKKLQQQVKKGVIADLLGAADKLLAAAVQVKGTYVIVGEMPAGPEEQMRNQIDRLKQKAGSAVVVFGWRDDGKVGLLAAVTDDLVQKGLHAGKLIGQVAKVVGGGGGGKPTLAQAGGKEPGKLRDALDLARQLAQQQLTGS